MAAIHAVAQERAPPDEGAMRSRGSATLPHLRSRGNVNEDKFHQEGNNYDN